MKSSEAKLAANRANAQRSTGPKSDAGKARSARNAVTYGLRCRELLLLPGEDPLEYAALREQCLDHFAPADGWEHVLTERVFEGVWRRRRVAVAEAGVLRAAMYKAQEDRLRTGQRSLMDSLTPVPPAAIERARALRAQRDHEDNNLGRAVAENIDVLLKLSCAEGRLEGSLKAAMTDLARAQGERQQRMARAALATDPIIDAEPESGAVAMVPNEPTLTIDAEAESGAAAIVPNEPTATIDAEPESDAEAMVPNEPTATIDAEPESDAEAMVPNEPTLTIDADPESGVALIPPNEPSVANDADPESDAAPPALNEPTVANDAVPESDASPFVPNEPTGALDIVPESDVSPIMPNEPIAAADESLP